MDKGKTLMEFETTHGLPKMKRLQRELAVEREKVEALAGTKDKVHIEKQTDKNTIRFALCGDTQVGNAYACPENFVAFVEVAKQRGCEVVLHTGDVLDGWKVYKGQEFELRDVGFESQIKRLQEVAPKGMRVKFITGNHDASFKNLIGVNVGQAIADACPGWECVGEDQGLVEFRTANGTPYLVGLYHMGGGTAYAVSYRPQKAIESMEGGKKPNMAAYGHFHKAELLPSYRNVCGIQTGCFGGQVGVSTPQGVVSISSLRKGDHVFSHTGAVQKVEQVFQRQYSGEWTELFFGRKNSGASRLSCTAEHPIGCLVDGEVKWVIANSIAEGDWVVVRGATCQMCGVTVPYFLRYCDRCNPMDNLETRVKASLKRHGAYGKSCPAGGSKCEQHLVDDIVPGCRKLQQEGWLVVPVGGGVIPDAVGFKNGAVALFEFEDHHCLQLTRKQKKYERADWLKEFPHAVRWIDTHPRASQGRSEYLVTPSGMVAVRVTKTQSVAKPKGRVWNLEVANDHSYFASNVAVHNCFEWQTPFMVRMPTPAHVGGWIVEVQPFATGAIIKAEFVAFYRERK